MVPAQRRVTDQSYGGSQRIACEIQPAGCAGNFPLTARSQTSRAPASGIDPIQFGVENIRRSLELIIEYSTQQRLIPRRFKLDELFDDVTRAL